MIKIKDENIKISYKILCPDFNESFIDEYFGIIEYNKIDKTFKHVDNKLWIDNNIYPIEIFEIDLEARKKLVKEKYPEYAAASWAMKILFFIDKYLRNNQFPDRQGLFA